jgi:hypothetical protein
MNEIFHDIASKVSDGAVLATLADILTFYNVDATTQGKINAVASDNLRWLERHTSDIQDFLDDFHSDASMSALSMSCLLIMATMLLL